MAQVVPVKVAEDLVAHHLQHLHIELKVEEHRDQVVLHAPDKAVALVHHVLDKEQGQERVAHLAKVAERKRITRVRKLAAKK